MQSTAKSSIKHQDDGALSSLRSGATAAALEPAFATHSSCGAQRDLLPGAFRLLLVGPASGVGNQFASELALATRLAS